MRERTRGTKLEGAFQKRKGTLLEQSNHTITFLPAGRTQSTIGNQPAEPCCSREAAKRTQREPSSDDSITVIKTIPAETPTPKERATPVVETKTNQKAERAKKPAALATLKSKAREQNKRRNKNKPRKPTLETTAQFEVEDDSEEEEHPVATTSEPEIKTEATATEIDEAKTPGSSKSAETTIRRGSRNRPKPDFYGNNVMVGNVETPKEEPQPEEQEPERE